MADDFLQGVQIGSSLVQRAQAMSIARREAMKLPLQMEQLRLENELAGYRARVLDTQLKREADELAETNAALDRFRAAQAAGKPIDEAMEAEIFPLAAKGNEKAARIFETHIRNKAYKDSIVSRFDTAAADRASKEYIASLKTQSAERIAEERSRLMGLQKAIDNAFAERRINNEEHRLRSQETSMRIRDIELELRAREKGFQIDNRPQIGGPTATNNTPTLTPIPRPPTEALVTQSQKNLVAAEKTLGELNDFDASVQAGHVGFRGVVGEALFDKLLPQFGFDTSDIQRMRSRGTLGVTIEGSLRQMSNDSRFSNEDRRDIKRIMPGVGIVESLEHTKQTTQLLRRVLSKRALIDANAINRPAPPFALENYGKALSGSFRSGLMTRQDIREDIKHSLANGLLDKNEAADLFVRYLNF